MVCEKLPQTNNVAEWCSLYMAVVYVGTIATTQIYDKFVFVGDSELIVKQARGEYAVSSPNIKGLAENTIRMISDISHEHGCLIEIQWIPRELNKEADALGRTIR
jgi:ribonuclease HI